ncbi:hypothetical protein QQ045_015749 [Rhodiola kirilowii]
MLIEEPLALKALNLKNFYFDDHWLEFITFKDTPNLTCVSLLATEQIDKLDIPLLFSTLERLSSVSMINELTFSFLLLELTRVTLLATDQTDKIDIQQPYNTLERLDSLSMIKELTYDLLLLELTPAPEFKRGFEYEEALGEAAKLLESEAKKYESYNNLQTIQIGGTAIDYPNGAAFRSSSLSKKQKCFRDEGLRCSTKLHSAFQLGEFGVAVDDWCCSRPHIDRVIEGKEGMADGEIDDEMDRISELPVNLREHILDCLSITDAVATSVLSSKWRCCWTGLRKLKFDEDFWDFGGDSTLLEHARVIDRILMLHSGPIREFILFIPDIKYKTVDINMWLRVLSNNGVQKIEIDAHEYKEVQTGGPFPMPSCLFHCRELEELSLCNCKITLPSDFKGFANLTSLSLDYVDIAPSILGSLISGCLLLETLSLKDLALEEPLAIVALNLKTFYFDDCELENIIFKEIPKLTCVSLLATGETEKIDTLLPYSTLERLCSLPRIEELTYDFLLLEPLENCPTSISTPLETLKSLTLRSVNLCFSEDILFTLCLLKSAPNLKNLTLQLNSKVGCRLKIKKLQGAAAKLLESEAKKHISYHSLQTIRIRGIEGLRHESLLFKLLQTRCRKLKSIIIETGR